MSGWYERAILWAIKRRESRRARHIYLLDVPGWYRRRIIRRRMIRNAAKMTPREKTW
jgi:hypothetical protein